MTISTRFDSPSPQPEKVQRFLTSTSIHAALGEEGPLDYAMIERAVDQGVGEDQTLDWKGGEYRQVPEQDPGDEFAKDVAALANARGGILVLGVSEERRTGRASKLTPVTITDALERQMRAWLNARVSPRIEGIRFVPLLRDAGAEEGVLIISIPASPDMPHMIGEKKSCGFPYRYGTQTRWMREFDLERAYRDRFERREADEAVLARSIRDASDYLRTGGQCWVVAAARPTTPLPTRVHAPSREQVKQVMADAEATYGALMPEGFRRANPGIATPSGVSVGMAETEVLDAYADATVERVPNIYEAGDDLVVSAGTDGHVLRFQFDEDRRVSTIHNGERDAALLPEGCA